MNREVVAPIQTSPIHPIMLDVTPEILRNKRAILL